MILHVASQVALIITILSYFNIIEDRSVLQVVRPLLNLANRVLSLQLLSRLCDLSNGHKQVSIFTISTNKKAEQLYYNGTEISIF